MADVHCLVFAKGNLMSTVLITSEELSALLGSEAKSVKARAKTYRNKYMPYENARQPRQIYCVESGSTRSLRDLVSNDEIAALLVPHSQKTHWRTKWSESRKAFNSHFSRGFVARRCGRVESRNGAGQHLIQRRFQIGWITASLGESQQRARDANAESKCPY